MPKKILSILRSRIWICSCSCLGINKMSFYGIWFQELWFSCINCARVYGGFHICSIRFKSLLSTFFKSYSKFRIIAFLQYPDIVTISKKLFSRPKSWKTLLWLMPMLFQSYFHLGSVLNNIWQIWHFLLSMLCRLPFDALDRCLPAKSSHQDRPKTIV